MVKEELKQRRLLASCTMRLNHAAYRHYEGKSLPNEGEYFLEGNVLLTVRKDGTGPVPTDIFTNQKKFIGEEKTPHHSLVFGQGPMYHIERRVYELTDGEMCWRY